MSTVVVELYEALRKAGVDETLARSAASAVVPANALGDLATRSDVSALKNDLEALRLATKHDLAILSAETKSDLQGIRVEMAELKADLIKWNLGTMVALTALCVAIMRLG